MKKVLIVFALLAILATGTAFADHPSGWGIGVVGRGSGNWGYATGGVGGGAALSLKAPELPVYWGIDFDMWASGIAVGVTGDYYLIDRMLVSEIDLHWFLGPGFYFNLGIGSPVIIDFGARLPIGLSWQPIDFLEVFIELAPSIGARFAPNVGIGGGWRAGLGVRFWPSGL